MKRSERRGQSLLEMLIALTMLTVSFLGIAALLSRSFFLNRVATQETIGSYLAAEGIEVTKSIIDHDVYDGNQWDVCCAANTYTVTATSTALSINNIGSYLKFNANTHLYQYNNGQATPFKRKIVITLPSPYEIDVKSIVTWSEGPIISQTITDEDQFYDWHP